MQNLQNSVAHWMQKLRDCKQRVWSPQAEPITISEEELMWEKGVLGDHNAEALLNKMVYMNGLYFALRSGDEHRNLRLRPCQIR